MNEVILESELREKYNELLTIFKKLKQLRKEKPFDTQTTDLFNKLKHDMSNVSGTFKICEERGYMDAGIKIILDLAINRLMDDLTVFYECFVPPKQSFNYGN